MWSIFIATPHLANNDAPKEVSQVKLLGNGSVLVHIIEFIISVKVIPSSCLFLSGLVDVGVVIGQSPHKAEECF